MNVYLDTSVVVSLMMEDDRSTKAVTWSERITPAFIISNFVRLEFSATVSRHIRAGRRSTDEAVRTLTFFDDWALSQTRCVDIITADVDLASHMVRDFATKLASPDAMHLAIASRMQIPIATFDRRLAEAAGLQKIEAVVPA